MPAHRTVKKHKKASTRKVESSLEKAQTLFVLCNPEPATERGWAAYIANRLGASHFRGGTTSEEFSDDEEDSVVSIQKAVKTILTKLGEEMGLEDDVLLHSFRILDCDAEYDEDEEPQTVTTLTRIYSPTRPTYVDVHFTYHSRSRSQSIEWCYKLGFKIYSRPGSSDYAPSILRRFESGSFDDAYSSDGWRPIAYGYYDDEQGWSGRQWKRVEEANFSLGSNDVQDIYKALWGPLEELPRSSGATNKATLKHRRALVNTVRVLLGAVGIDYVIAITDDEVDNSRSSFALEGSSDRWFARETRKACGFQLKFDPANEARGREDRQEERRGGEDCEEYGDDSSDSEHWREVHGNDNDH